MSEPSSSNVLPSKFSRRKLIATGLAATAGVAGVGVAARLAQTYGLVPPDHGGIWGLGETLTYASQRLLTKHSLAREFSRSQISKPPFANEIDPLTGEFKRLQAGGFADWRLSVNGMVGRPATFSIDQLKSYPSHSQITMLQCEEGWSYIAEWIGVPLASLASRGGSPASAIRCLLLDRLRLVGKYRHGRRVASADPSHLWHEWRRASRGPRWAASPAAPAPGRLQEREVPHPPDGHRQSEKVRQGSGRRECRSRLCLVCRNLRGLVRRAAVVAVIATARASSLGMTSREIFPGHRNSR